LKADRRPVEDAMATLNFLNFLDHWRPVRPAELDPRPVAMQKARGLLRKGQLIRRRYAHASAG
jgi:hypothetical protein